jgi:hypothetical protein
VDLNKENLKLQKWLETKKELKTLHKTKVDIQESTGAYAKRVAKGFLDERIKKLEEEQVERTLSIFGPRD